MVIVGWGWERHGNNLIPYWKVRNSWGKKWGENGYARVVRGVNEMAIERVAVTADVLFFRGDHAVLPEDTLESRIADTSDSQPSELVTPFSKTVSADTSIEHTHGLLHSGSDLVDDPVSEGYAVNQLSFHQKDSALESGRGTSLRRIKPH